MAETPDIFLHVGAHRTGSSSFQMFLDMNAASLRAQGYDLAYPGRDGIPGGKLAMKLPSPRHPPRKAREFDGPARAEIDAMRKGKPRLILSEENIPGRMIHFMDAQFYPAKAVRVQTLARILPGPVKNILLVVRSYDYLFTSAYRMRTEGRQQWPFEIVRPSFLKMTEGWPDLVAVLQAELKPEKLTVLAYEARGDNRNLLAHLVPGLDGAAMVEPERRLNLTATDAALLELQWRFHADLKPDAAEIAAIIAKHADHTADLGVTRFPEDERAALQARYLAHLDRIAAMPGVDFIRA